MTTPKDLQFNLRLSQEELDMLHQLALDADMSAAAWLRQRVKAEFVVSGTQARADLATWMREQCAARRPEFLLSQRASGPVEILGSWKAEPAWAEDPVVERWQRLAADVYRLAASMGSAAFVLSAAKKNDSVGATFLFVVHR